MGYAVYEDHDARSHGVTRWAGYGVPAICDMPRCDTKVDRGLDYKCETHYSSSGEGESEGCGLFFCYRHVEQTVHDGITPKPDTTEWVTRMLTDESWQAWRAENPDFVIRHAANDHEAHDA